MEVFLRTFAAVTANYAVHYASIKLYDAMCVPATVWDIPMGFVTAARPMCTTMLSVATHTQSAYATIVTASIATGVGSYLTRI